MTDSKRIKDSLLKRCTANQWFAATASIEINAYIIVIESDVFWDLEKCKLGPRLSFFCSILGTEIGGRL